MADRRTITFYSTSKDCLRWLSNFAPTPITYDDCRFPTGEHAFQYAKFLLISNTYQETSKRRRVLLRYACRFIKGSKEGFGPSGSSAKEAGDGKPLTLEEKEFYGSFDAQVHMRNVQRDILRQKALVKEVQQALATLPPGALLLHFDATSTREHPSVWGGRLDEDTGEIIGENTLGLLWEDYFPDDVLVNRG